MKTVSPIQQQVKAGDSSAAIANGVQTKLSIGKANDKYEQEADNVADKVMRMPGRPFVQRKADGGDKEDMVSMKQDTPFVQLKCHDCEKEDKQKVQRKGEDDDEGKVQTKPAGSFLQMKCADCANEEKEKVQRKESEDDDKVQRKESEDDDKVQAKSDKPTPPAGASFSKQLSASKSGGSAMDAGTQSFMQSRMGADFSNVKIHTDAEAADMNQQIGAQAFTHRNHVYFNSNKYQPGSAGGKKLLAHELTHTIQQGAVTQDKQDEKSGKDNKKETAPESTTVTGKDAKADTGARKGSQAQQARRQQLEAQQPVSEEIRKIDPAKEIKLPDEAGNVVKANKKKKKKGDPEELNASPAAKKLKDAAKKKKKPTGKPKKKAAGKEKSPEAKMQAQQAAIDKLVNRNINFKVSKKDKGNKEAEKRIRTSESAVGGFMRNAGSRFSSTVSVLENRIPQIVSASENSKAQITAEATKQKAAIAAKMKKLTQEAKARTGGTVAGINKRHAATVSAVTKAAGTAKSDIQKAYDAAVKLLDKNVADQLPKIDKIYVDAAEKFRQAGVDAGNHAVSIGNKEGSYYQQFVTGKDDSLLDGPLTSDRYEARAKTAREVGKQYKESDTGLVAEGKKQADELLKGDGKSNDLKVVNENATKTREALKLNYDNALKGVEAAKTQAIDNAGKTQKGLTSAAYKALKATLSTLKQQEEGQVKLIDAMQKGLTDNIDKESAFATDSIYNAIAAAGEQVHSSLQQFRDDAVANEAPDPKQLNVHLAPASKGFEVGMKKIQADTLKGIGKNVSQIVNGTKLGLAEMRTTTAAGLAQAQELADGLKPVMQQLTSSAASSFTTLQTGTVESIRKTAADAGDGFNKMATGINDVFKVINDNLTKGLDDSSKKVKDAFIAAVDKDIYTTIKKEGDKAAAEVQPRWKSVLKVLLVIVVILVVALVVGPAVIGFVTAGAAALGAGAAAGTIGLIVGGAIVGAASGAVIQMGNNIIDNKPLFEGVGKAALIGAVSGALGGAGGALGQAITKGAQGLAPALIRFGVDMAFDVGGNIAVEAVQAYAEGRKMNWGDILKQSAISAGMGIGMANIGKIPKVGAKIEGIQGASMKFGEGLGAKVGAKIKPPKVEAPDVKVPDAPKVDAPEIEAPKVETPKTEVESPTAKTDTDTPTPKTETEAPVAKTGTETPAPKGKADEAPTAKGKAEEGGAPKTDSPAVKPDEPEVKAGGDAETKPADPDPGKAAAKDAQLEEGVAGKYKTEDGHEVKALENGMIAKCSTCEILDVKFKSDMDANPKLKEEFDAIKKIEDPVARAKAAAEFEQNVTKGLIDEYKAKYPNTKLSDADIKAYIDDGYRLNPQTGRFKHVGTGDEIKLDLVPAKPDDDFLPKAFKGDDIKAGAKPELETNLKAREDAKVKSDDSKADKSSKDFKDSQRDMRKASEKIGEHGADSAMKKAGLTDKDPIYEGSNSRTVDRVYEGKDGKLLVVEAKGGNSPLGTKKGTGEFAGKELQQGSKEYLQQTINEMRDAGLKGDAEKLAIAKKMQTALDNNKLEYYHYQQKIDGPNLGEGSLSKFDIK